MAYIQEWYREGEDFIYTLKLDESEAKRLKGILDLLQVESEYNIRKDSSLITLGERKSLYLLIPKEIARILPKETTVKCCEYEHGNKLFLIYCINN